MTRAAHVTLQGLSGCWVHTDIQPGPQGGPRRLPPGHEARGVGSVRQVAWADRAVGVCPARERGPGLSLSAPYALNQGTCTRDCE